MGRGFSPPFSKQKGNMASRESSVPLIRTKLYRPSVPLDVVGRDRLFQLMGRAFEVPLTLVSAPAGYGKSVLVAQWAEHCEHPVAWLSLDEDESDLRLFLQYLVAAVHTVAEGACRATEELLQATELPPPSVLAGHLLNDFEALGQPLAIVLDDYHRIQISSPVHDLIGRLLEHPPSSVCLVLVTRRDPPLPFMSLLAGNQVAEVRLEDLRFTGGETAEFLSATAEAELAISDEALANLQQQVEGWAAGLRLVILALRHAVDPESLLGGLRGGLPQTRAYLFREALSGLSPEDRDWLLRSSILDRFCAPLLEAVCCPDGASAHPELTGRKFLDLIQRNNLFTVALDTEGEWFRYHHLFQDLLQRQLRETSSSEDIASLHLRAAEWFESEGLIDEALKHTLAAEEFAGHGGERRVVFVCHRAVDRPAPGRPRPAAAGAPTRPCLGRPPPVSSGRASAYPGTGRPAPRKRRELVGRVADSLRVPSVFPRRRREERAFLRGGFQACGRGASFDPRAPRNVSQYGTKHDRRA